MRHLWIVLALVAGNDDPPKPGFYPGTQGVVNPEHVVGRYKLPDGLESHCELIITKEGNGYHFKDEFSTDDGGSFSAQGPAQFVGDRIDLVLKTIEQNREFTHNGKTYAEIGILSFYLIRWDKTTYLVPAEEFANLCNELNLGSKPGLLTYRNYYELQEAEGNQGPRSTIADLPPRAKKLVLGKPIAGKVVSVENGRAKIDLGEQDKVWKDMLLYCEPDEPEKSELQKRGDKEYQPHCVLLKVVEVKKTYCLVEIDEKQRNHDLGNIRKGYKVSSQFPASLSRQNIRHNYKR
jgi:hypothetical protein